MTELVSLGPGGRFVAEADWNPVWTACVLGGVTWIAMVLVDINVRGRVVSIKLVRHCFSKATLF